MRLLLKLSRMTKIDMDIQETIQRVAADPYSENVTHGGLHPSSIVDIINNLFWSGDQNFDKVTLEISKEQDDHYIAVRIIDRES